MASSSQLLLATMSMASYGGTQQWVSTSSAYSGGMPAVYQPPPSLRVVTATQVAGWLFDLGVTNARVRVLPPGAADETRQTEAGALTLAHEFPIVMVQHRGELYEWPVQTTDAAEAHAQFVTWWAGLQPAAETPHRRGMDV